MLDGRQPCRHPDVDHYGQAISVDAINTAGVSAGHLASFGVVSRRQFRCYPSSSRFLSPGSIPGSSTQKMLVRATGSGQFLFVKMC
jgi:hypothetical protein